MAVILGIDVGGSTTKIVGFSPRDSMIGALQVRATDQITSMYGAIGRFLREYGISLKNVSEIVLTGVGASFIHENIYDIPTHKIDEFRAIGLGGVKLSKLKEALVVSMGTGSAYIRVSHGEVAHIGGSGVGGGTLVGLSSKLINETDIEVIAKIAKQGDLSNVDLSIKDISNILIPNLPPDTTAANFGKIKNMAASADMALGLINMVFQTVGMLAVFACQQSPVRDVVLTGSLTVLPQAKEVFNELGSLHRLNFIIPPYSVFATAIGATVPYLG